MDSVKGMVQVAGVTYRIVRLLPGAYSAVRIRDEAKVGTFTSRPQLRVTSSKIEVVIMDAIARAALMGAKISWARALS